MQWLTAQHRECDAKALAFTYDNRLDERDVPATTPRKDCHNWPLRPGTTVQDPRVEYGETRAYLSSSEDTSGESYIVIARSGDGWKVQSDDEGNSYLGDPDAASKISRAERANAIANRTPPEELAASREVEQTGLGALSGYQLVDAWPSTADILEDREVSRFSLSVARLNVKRLRIVGAGGGMTFRADVYAGDVFSGKVELSCAPDKPPRCVNGGYSGEDSAPPSADGG